MRRDLPPGYRMRTATRDDIPALVAVARACDLEDIGEFDVFEGWVHDEWLRPRFDPSTDAWIVTGQGGEVVAAAYTWDEEPRTVFDSAGWVHPAHRGRGIGAALVLAVEDRALRDLAQVPAGSAPRVLQSFDADASGAHDPDASGARALFERLGYSPEREYLHMAVDVPDRFDAGDALAGVAIRPRVEADDRAIVAVMADAFDDPWDYEEARQEFIASKAYDPSLWPSPSTAPRRSGRCSGTSRTGAGRSAPSVCALRGGGAASPVAFCARRSRCSGAEAPTT